MSTGLFSRASRWLAAPHGFISRDGRLAATARKDTGGEPTARKQVTAIQPLKVGDVVKIRHSDYKRARIVQLRGPLGPGGAQVYRVRVRRKPTGVRRGPRGSANAGGNAGNLARIGHRTRGSMPDPG